MILQSIIENGISNITFRAFIEKGTYDLVAKLVIHIYLQEAICRQTDRDIQEISE